MDILVLQRHQEEPIDGIFAEFDRIISQQIVRKKIAHDERANEESFGNSIVKKVRQSCQMALAILILLHNRP